MAGKIDHDAFAFYVALGHDRSYEQVARHYKCSKRAVVNRASKQGWSKRLAAIEEETRKLTDAKIVSEMHAMQLRHENISRAILGRAAKAISEYPLRSGFEGVRAAEIGIKLERLISGQPSERNVVSIEAITKRELERYVAPAQGSLDFEDGEEELESGDDW